LIAQQMIERRAYELWKASGGGRNDPMADWLRAENEVLIEFCECMKSKAP
jgi:hypothetical protein